MKLKSIELQNFQGIKSLHLDFDGRSASIYGTNATGKTTVFNALTWLLFDKDSTGAKGYTPKTKGKDGDLHYLNHSAEGAFIKETGQIISFKKIYHEVYTKTRGTNEENMTGNTTDYYVDGVPAKEKDYNDILNNLCGGSEKMKILTMPDYFSEGMSWSDRRTILIDMCGNVKDADVLKGHKELKDLNKYLLMPGTADQLYTVDDYLKIAKSQKASIRKDLDAIPNRIDEAKRAMPEVTETDTVVIDNKISELSRKLDELVKPDIEFNINLSEKIYEAKRQQVQEKSVLQDMRGQYSDALRTIDRLTDLRQDLSDKYKAIQSEKWDENKSVCPTCNRELPIENIQKLKDTFETNKAQRLDAITRQAKDASKDTIESFVNKAKELKESISKQEDVIQDYEKKIAELETGLSYAPSPLKNGDQANAINNEIENLKELKINIATKATQEKRIAELAGQEKDLSYQFEKIEKGIFLCESFIRAKVSMLSEKINDKFRSVRFQLFAELQNGGIEEKCEVLIPSADGSMVPYSRANHAGRVNAGIEIIEALSKHWNLSLPIFFDNAESVVELQEVNAQVVKLYVSGKDKKLRLELE